MQKSLTPLALCVALTACDADDGESLDDMATDFFRAMTFGWVTT